MKQTMLTVFIVFLGVAGFASQTQPDGAAVYRSACASCHEGGGTRAPTRAVLGQLSATAIQQVLETGSMKMQGAALSAQDRRAVAAFLGTKSSVPTGDPVRVGYCDGSPQPFAAPLSHPHWNGWGADLTNSRFQTAKEAGLTAKEVPRLRLKWAFGLPSTVAAYAQPAVAGGRIFFGSASRNVYSLDARTGCIIWQFTAAAPVRAAVVIGPAVADNRTLAYFGDQQANVYALDAATGEPVWKTRVDDAPVARVTGAPALYAGKLYVPVSMPEDGLAANPRYECCRLRSSVVAVDAGTGKVIWKTYAVAEEPKPTGKNRLGVQQWGPSGASIWAAPTIDTKLGMLYVGTGDNHSHPTTDTSDAILAMDLATGKVVWSRQLTRNDAFNIACVRADKTNCPDPPGPDADFGSSAILVNLPNGRRALLCGQKSAVMHAIDPDRRGEILWQTRIGKGGALGGIQWGSAADADKVYVPLSDVSFNRAELDGPGKLEPDPKAGGGLFALRITTGERVWYAAPAPCGDRRPCSPAQSAAATAIPGVIFSGSLDGHIRAFSATDGRVVWDYDTAHDYETVNSIKGRGGSLDAAGPVVANGWLYVNSGYGYWGGMPGNVLLAFSVD